MRLVLLSSAVAPTIAGSAFVGCSSFRTTAVNRCENDRLVVNPHHPMKGIPVSLRVPSHLELSVVETTYWEKKDVAGKKPTLNPLHSCRPTRSVTHEVCFTEKIFLVDPVRPGAGTQSYGFSFKKNSAANPDNAGKGYLEKVEYRIDDQTIKESANLLANSLGLINALQTSAGPALPTTSNLIATDRTVAYARFDINAPNFENDVAEFLDCHVNCASNECGACPRVCEPALCQAE